MRLFTALCASAALAMPVAAYAQQITANVAGQVTDESGTPIANASVTVTDTRTGAARTITTGADGLWGADNLVTGGPYTIAVTAPGFQGQTVNDVNLSVQGTTNFTFQLAAAAGAEGGESIVVTAQRANVQLRAIGPGTAFSQTVIENAPSFNRDIRDVIRIDPRVSLDREDSATGGSGVDRISCLGGNDRGNLFTVDGIQQSDIYGLNDTGFSSRSSTPVPYDAVRETQVQFAPFDVEYGQFTGCAINVVTRSGGNQFHGEAFFEYSDNGLRGNSLRDERGDRVDSRIVGPIDSEERWGVALGGPIFRDRLFFFAAYEHQEAGAAQDEGPTGAGFANPVAGISIDQYNAISQIIQGTYGIETGPPPINRPFENDRWFARLDWQITDDHRLELTYQRLEEASVRTDDLFTGATPQLTGPGTFFNSGTNSDYYSARLYSQWTDNFSTEVRYSRSEITDVQNPVGGGEAQDANPIPRIIVGIDNPTGTPDSTLLFGPGTSRSANDLQTQVDLFRIVANLDAGDHQFKLGFEYNRAHIFNLFVQNATGTLVFRNAADLAAGLLSPGVNRPNTPPATGNLCTATNSTLPVNVINGCTFGAFGNFSRTGDVNDAAAEFTRQIFSVYMQDEWRLSDQFNVVAGVRVDTFSGGSPEPNPNFFRRYGFTNTTGFSDIEAVFLPRLAFTWDMDEFAVFSRPQLRGGVGVFSGGDPLVWFGNAFQNNGFGFAEGTNRAAGCPTGQIDVVVNGQFTGVPTCIQQNGIDQAARGLGDTQSIDPGIDMPTVFRANLGFQTDLNFQETGFFSGWHLNLDYIYSHFMDPYTIVDLAQTPAVATFNNGVAGPAIGLNGFTIDGRPIYRSIDPSVAGCTARLVDITPTPVYQNVNAVCFNTQRDDELMLTNAGSYDSHTASFILSKNFDAGIFTQGGSSYFTLGYAWSDSNDRRNMFNSTAGSNYDLTAAIDRQNPEVTRSFYNSRHNITFSGSFAEQFFEDMDTRLGFTFVARSGRPYSLTSTGGAVFNDSVSGNSNALMYIPTGGTDPNISPPIFNAAGVRTGGSDPAAAQALADFASGLDCARRFIGRSITRNTCSNDWYYDLDLVLSQELPGPARLFGVGGMQDRIRVYAMFDNFLNMLNRGWNIQRRRNFAGLQEMGTITGVDAQGRYIITSAAPIIVDTNCADDNPNNPTCGTSQYDRDNFINVSGSVWRIKIGVSYEF